MAHAVGDFIDGPIYGAHYGLIFPLLDADGDPISPSSPDSEVSKDLGTFADCTNEAVELATSSGICYLYLTGAEMTAKAVAVQIKSSGAKTTVLTFNPRRLPVLETGTATAGAGSTITLASGSLAKPGMYVLLTNNTPSGCQYQARRILSMAALVATVESAWGTNPDNTTTYSILLAESVNVVAWGGSGVPASGGSAGIFRSGIVG